MKKIIAFIILLSLFLNLSGYHAFFYLRKLEIKTEIKQKLRSSKAGKDIEQFVFSLDDKDLTAGPEWEGDDEFRFNGEMYDVIEKWTENNKIIVRCISDKKETRLLKDFEKANKDDFNGSSSKHKFISLLKLACCIYVYQSNNESSYCNSPLISHGTDCSLMIPTICMDILIPPPKIA